MSIFVTINQNLNVRIGSASVNAPCYTYIEPGNVVEVEEKPVEGDPYEGSNLWYKGLDGNYYWSGGVINDNRIKHVFVLMLENRSFDHMLGYSGIRGRNAETLEMTDIDGIKQELPHANPDYKGKQVLTTTDNVPYAVSKVGPGHEFSDTFAQLTGIQFPGKSKIFPSLVKAEMKDGAYPANINNNGFVQNYSNQNQTTIPPDLTKLPPDPDVVMKCFPPGGLPVLQTLAESFVVCDKWFSALPGPTWPNRFFVHAATSGGLDDSPTLKETLKADYLKGYDFDNGTIYELMTRSGVSWAIYAGSALSQVFALKGIKARDLRNFRDSFKKDIGQPNFPSYVFIEPNWGNLATGTYANGDSQHPVDDVHQGEALIKYVYQTIRNSPLWAKSMLIVTYDEHGGFYDHVPPAPAVDPGDSKTYSRFGFDFKTHGVRVPAVIISPLIEPNLIDKRIYDHTSILATAEKIFRLPHLTERDKHANTFDDLVTREVPRDTPSLEGIGPSTAHYDVPAAVETEADDLAQIENADEDVDSSLAGFVHLASLRNLPESGTDNGEQVAQLTQIETKQDALDYINSVV
jgi:phospholipase C